MGFLDLWHGECRGGGVVAADRAPPRAVSDAYSRWREVLEGDLDPIRGMSGQAPRAGRPARQSYVSAANELVHLTGTVDTEFPDGD
jgi:hypothetical protein